MLPRPYLGSSLLERAGRQKARSYKRGWKPYRVKKELKVRSRKGQGEMQGGWTWDLSARVATAASADL